MSVTSATLTLKRTDLLAGLDERAAAAVASLGKLLAFREGATLFSFGQPAEFLFVVREGRIDLTVPLVVMGEPTPVRLESRGPGETLGWCALVPPQECPFDAVAATSVVALAFDRAALLELIAVRPEVGLKLISNAAAALAKRNVRLQALWLREMQRDVDHLVAREAGAWNPQSSS